MYLFICKIIYLFEIAEKNTVNTCTIAFPKSRKLFTIYFLEKNISTFKSVKIKSSKKDNMPH